MKKRTPHRALAWTVVFALLTAALPVAAEGPESNGTGQLTGLVLDPDGKPARGFKLVFVAEGGDLEMISSPSDKSGRFTANLPSGLRYELVAAIAPDGSRLDVPPLPAIPVENGARRLDVQFHYPSVPAVAGAAPDANGTTSSRGRGAMWWQIGAAVGATLLFGAVVFNRDDPEPVASPHRP